MKILLIILGILSFNCLFAQNPMFDICPLKVGEELPEVSLVSEKNELVELAELVAEKPSVLVFYRGAWCGYCTKHLAELNEIKDEIEQLGFNIFGITVDKAEKLQESTIEAGDEISVYSDAKLAAISAFGLDWKVGDELFDKYINSYNLDLEKWSGEKHHTLPVPAIYIIKEGKVEFQYVNPNYNTRLKPETLLAILKTL